MEKETKETIKTFLHLYTFSQALSSTKMEKLSDMKLKKDDIKSELVPLHYRMVEKSSILNSRKQSVAYFKLYFKHLSTPS